MGSKISGSKGTSMPTYEYECGNCGKQFEFFQSISEAPKNKCEECGGTLTKLLSAGSGLIFKGSGFYITDYKSKSGADDSKVGETKAGGESKGGENKLVGSESKKSESKSAESSPIAGNSTTASTEKG
jgi:putative FmdB family regulatory protein